MYLNLNTEGDREKVCKLDFYKMRLFVSVFVRACFLHLTLSDLT